MKNQRNYDREFKINAVKLYRESGKSYGQLSQDLGVPLATLAQWIKRYKDHGEEGFPGSGSLMPCDSLKSRKSCFLPLLKKRYR